MISFNSLWLGTFYQQLWISMVFQTSRKHHLLSTYHLTCGCWQPEEMLHRVCELALNNYCTISLNSHVDQVQLCASDVLTLGLLYTEFSDAIREWDCPRMIKCYRYFLPLFSLSARTNCSKNVLLWLYNIDSKCSPVKHRSWCGAVL